MADGTATARSENRFLRFHHGTALDSANHLAQTGVDQQKAATWNGSGEFWATVDHGRAAWFARSHPVSPPAGCFEFELAESMLQAILGLNPPALIHHAPSDYEFLPSSFAFLNRYMFNQQVAPFLEPEIMQQPPVFTAWLVRSPTPEQSGDLQAWLASRIDLDRVVTDTIRVAAKDQEEVRAVPHRLGDYFAGIRTLPLSAASFRLVFQRLPEAKRYWKDLMVNILQEIEDSPATLAITLDYKGDAEPAANSATG